MPYVSYGQMLVGSTITVHTRQYKLEDYGDDYTRKKFEASPQKYTNWLQSNLRN